MDELVWPGSRPQQIAMVLHAQYRYFLVRMAQRLTSSGCGVHLYCHNKDQVRYMQTVPGAEVFASINDSGVLYRTIRTKALNPHDVVERATAIEGVLGKTLNEFAVADRHLGRGYAPTGFHHPRSHYSEETSYYQLLHGLTKEAEFWLEEFTEKAIELVISGGLMANAAARARQIPFRCLFGSRTENFHYWGTESSGDNPAVQKAFEAQKGSKSSIGLQPYFSHQILRTRSINDRRFMATVSGMASAVVNQLKWILRKDVRVHEYYLRARLLHLYHQWRSNRSLGRGPTIGDLDGLKCVFFPLQTDPEVSLQGFSPEFFFQHTAILALSRDIPAGYRLVVKDCIEALGRRSPHFYQQLRELKNVILVDPLEQGIEIVKKSVAVASISSSAAFEAVVMGKPVISFGRHNIFEFLPHVFNVKDLGNLKPALNFALSPEFNPETARKDGEKFLRAVVETSFDMRDYDYLHLKNFDPRIVGDAVSLLIESLESEAPKKPIASEKDSNEAV